MCTCMCPVVERNVENESNWVDYECHSLKSMKFYEI